MKPKEIIKQANLSEGFNKREQKVFFDIMLNEIKEDYWHYGVWDSDRHFNAAVKTARAKWDAISVKIPRGLSDGVWGFFYANWVAPVKGELCPTWKARNDAWLRKKEQKEQQRILNNLDRWQEE